MTQTRGQQLVVIGHSTDDSGNTDTPAARAHAVKQAAADLIDLIEHLCPPGRWNSLAVTNVEQASMWATKALFNDPPEWRWDNRSVRS